MNKRTACELSDEAVDGLAERWNHFGLEPGVELLPTEVVERRVGRGEVAGHVLAPGADGFGEVLLHPRAEVYALRIHAREDREADVGEVGEDVREPDLAALLARREVAHPAFSGVAEADGYDGDARLVVEGIAVELHPGAERVAAAVVPGDAGVVDLRSGRLADDEQAGAGLHAKDGPWSEREVLADGAGADIAQERIERAVFFFLLRPHKHHLYHWRRGEGKRNLAVRRLAMFVQMGQYAGQVIGRVNVLDKSEYLRLNRREALKTGAAALAALGAGRAAGAKEAMERRPNILLLHCHDIGVYLNCYGKKTVQSPNLDAFAAEGVRFANNFCTAPQCSPSRASMFTGRYPHNNGVMGLCHAEFAWDLYPDEVHLAQMLRDAGYTADAVGIIHETHSGYKRCGYESHSAKAKVSDMATEVIGRLERLAAAPEKPFFLCAGCIEPHRLRSKGEEDYMGFLSAEFGPDDTLGVDVPGHLRDTPGTRAELAELQGAVHHVDTHMGRIIEAVGKLGLDDNTLVIFTTDHGYAMPRAKCSLYDPGLAIALIMRLPSRRGWHGGVVREEMISNVDFLPTILELVGAPVPANVQGRSFAPLLDGGDYRPREEIFGEISHHDYYDPRRCIRTDRYKLILNFSSAPFFMDPSQSWRPRSDTAVPENPAVAYHPCLELYDLQEDPWELQNLAKSPKHEQVRQELIGRLRNHLVSTKDPILEGAITPPQHKKTLEVLFQKSTSG